MLIQTRERELPSRTSCVYTKRKFRFPVAFHLIQAVGALTLHTGVGTICYTMGIKNANGIVGELSRLYKMECTAKMRIYF